MRILHISTSTIPSNTANSIQVMKMCQAMTMEGHQVQLLTPLRQKAPPASDEELWQRYGIRATFEVTWLRSSAIVRGYDYQLRAVGQALKWRPEIVYTRHTGAAAMCSAWNVPTIYEAHCMPLGMVGPLYFRIFLHGRGCRLLVFISEGLQRLHLRAYPQVSTKCSIIAHDGVDLECYQSLPAPDEAKCQLGLPQDRLVVGYTGSLYAGRGLDLILELAERLPGMHFLIVGGDEQAVTAGRSRAESMALSNLSLVGFVDPARVPLYQAASDVLLMPYQESVSGSSGGDIAAFTSPIKMFEYMAAGRLIVSSNLPVLQEVLHAGNAALCPPADTGAWKQALERAEVDPDWRLRLGRQARHDVEQYSWRRRVQRVLGELASCP